MASSPSPLKFSVVGIFILMVIGMLYFAKGFLLPVTLAFLLALIFSPLVRQLERLHIPTALSAVGVVLFMTLGLGALTWSLSGPVSRMIDDAPRIGLELSSKLEGLNKPMEAVKNAEKTIEKATTDEASPGVQEVVVREPGLLTKAASGAPEVLASVGLTLVLLLFLLASGDLFYEKLVRSLPTMKDKKRWLRIAYDVERDVSRYLFTVALINICLGACVTVGLYFVGMADPLLWGVAAALLNFIPYLGPLVGALALAVTAILAMPTLGQALLPPLVYLGCNLIEGQFVTPALLGRRLQINAVAVFLAIAFWGWLWGGVGVFMAVPILIIVKTFAQHAEGAVALGEFLSIRGHQTQDEAA